MTEYVTRIAPSPTGDMHLGTCRTAYFNFLAAKASGGKFFLRIDDTDEARNDPNVVKDILKIMAWLNMTTNGTIHQSEFFKMMVSDAKELVDNGQAYYDNEAIRLKIPDNLPNSFVDNIKGEIKITDHDRNLIDGMVLIKSNGIPTYNYSSPWCDSLLKINLIIRGVDHISNTPKQIAVWKALNYDIPEFAHVGLIMKNKKKLSKRDPENSASMISYKEKGYDPEAVKSFMLRLGWAPTVDNKENEIIDTNRAIQMFFDEGFMRSANSNFDISKLNNMHRKYRGRAGYVVPKDMSDMVGYKYEDGPKSLKNKS